MRKHRSRLLAPLLLILLLALPVGAEKYMEGEHADFQITVDEFGGATVVETWNCYFGGETITRYRRSYSVPDPSEMYMEFTDIRVDGVPLTILDAPDPSRPEGCAALDWTDNGATVEIYLKALNEYHTIEIGYYISGIVTVYDDVAEFHWNLSSEHEAFDIAEMDAHIEIPYGTRDRGLYFWGHGPEDHGTFEAVVDGDGMVNEFMLHTENITRGHGISVRYAMPPQLFPYAVHYGDGEMLDVILAQEGGGSTEVPTEAPTEVPGETYVPIGDPGPVTRSEALYDWMLCNFYPLFPISYWLSLILSLGLPVLLLLFRRVLATYGAKKAMPGRYAGIRLRPAQAPQYYRSLPDDMPPAMVHELMITYPATAEGEEAIKRGSAFSATVMDLVERGILQIEQGNGRDMTFFVEPHEDAGLTAYEQNVIDLYTAAGAAEAPVETEEITAYMRREYDWCKKHFTSFDGLVEQEFDRLKLQRYVPDEGWPLHKYLICGVVWALVVSIGFFLGSIFLWTSELSTAAVLSACSGILNAVLVGRVYRILHPGFPCLTQEGEDRYALWKAYGNFLRDFTLFAEREVPDVKVWRRYLVYATALGCSEKVMETLRYTLPQVYEGLMQEMGSGTRECTYDDFLNSVASIDQEGGYTIRPSGSGSTISVGSRDSDSGWGGFSDGGGDTDCGASGSDFD